MSIDAADFLERIKTGVSSTVDTSQLGSWLERNTAHPKLDGQNWSFEHHEYQIGILNDNAPELVGRKCSQVGFSEMTVRMVLGLLNLLPNHTAIYTLPTSGFASEFAKTRIDPVIQKSRILKNQIDPEVDNSALKKIGTSHLYIRGTFTQRGAISIPADILIHDEVDFSDPVAMTTYASRLGHAEAGGIKRKFSTPTVEGYGVSKDFVSSTQHYYGVRHSVCGKVVFPDFMRDVVVPGMENVPLEDFEKEDLEADEYDIDSAWLKCPECGMEISPANLADKDSRMWVAKYPDRLVHGYQVFPYDVIKYNPIAKTLRSVADYESKSDWVNFKIGLPSEDAASSFSEEVMQNHTSVRMLRPDEPAVSNCVAGIDVGKTSWILIGKPVNKDIKLVYAERIKTTVDGGILLRVLTLCKAFGVVKAVMDAGPDFTLSSGFVRADFGHRYFANYYVRNKTTSSLSHIHVDEEEGILKTARTVSFDQLVKRVNGGRYEFPMGAEGKLVKSHLRNMKRVKGVNSTGEPTANWVSVGDDHYAHALNYLNIAATLLEPGYKNGVTGSLPMMSTVRMKEPKNEHRVGL